MANLSISLITNINFVNVAQVVSLIDAFSISLTFEDIGQNLGHCKQIIVQITESRYDC